ncbi:MAG TPA: LysR family transcriptional regulator, partial [Aestuariivirga sp.]
MEHLNQVHLNGLRAVEVAGRLGTLALAAEELGVSIGAVSQQILKTEQQLGRTLFTRTPKGLVPTPFGTQVLAYFERGFRELSHGVALAQ